MPPPFIENIENKRNWLAYLEFAYTDRFGESNQDVPEDYSGEYSLWMRLYPHLSSSPRLTELIRGLEDKQNPVEPLKWSGGINYTKYYLIFIYCFTFTFTFFRTFSKNNLY